MHNSAPTRGVLMYAHNNSEIDYFKIACANALMVHKNLNVPVTLVTDGGSLDWGKQSVGIEIINKCFDTVTVVDTDTSFDNKRSYSDTSFSPKLLQFYNCNHWEAFALSPYDETLFIDADYLIMSDALANCWGSENDIMFNYSIVDTGSAEKPYYKYIDEFGIRQYWATVIYFRKSNIAEYVFNIVKHVQENYNYYRQLYLFANGMFRNDNAFSIASHMLSGLSSEEPVIKELPIAALIMSWDTDDIHTINGINDITLYAARPCKELYTLVRLKGQDVHIMNKWAINRISDKLIEIYTHVE
jgi:hypothetical protein